MKRVGYKLISALCCAALLFSFCPAAGAAKASSPQTAINLRVEGKSETVFSGSVSLDSGKSVYDYLKSALDGKGLTQATGSSDAAEADWAGSYYLPVSDYGAYVSRIKQDATTSDWSDTWSLYINGQSAMYGVSGLIPKEGDNIVIAYGGYSTRYPTVSITPRRPKAGQTVLVRVTATYVADYNTFATKTVNVAGAAVAIGGDSVQTGADGLASIKMPDAAGEYSVAVSKESAGTAMPEIVRTAVPLKVYDTLPAGDDGTGYSFATDDMIDAETDGSVSAKLNTAVSGSGKSAVLPADKTAVVRSGDRDFSLELKSGTVISGPSSWDGSIILPHAVASVSAPGAVVKLSVEAGAGTGLTLSKAARITLPGMHGYGAGYTGQDHVFHRITNVLSSDCAPDNPGPGYTAVYDNGTDLVIYTTHFTTFSAINDLASTEAAAGSCAAKLAADKSDWAAFALARYGAAPSKDWLGAVKSRVEANGGNYPYSSALASDMIALEANGFDVTDFCGVNLVRKLYSNENLDAMGLGGIAYSLLALDGKGFAVPAGAAWTAQKLIDTAISYQHADGSFSYSRDLSGDPDMTAIAIMALAPHAAKQTAAKTAVSRAVSWLAAKQLADGGFPSSFGTDVTSESVSQVIVALCTAGIDPKYDARFIKNGKTLLDKLMEYRTADGGFEHTAGGGFDLIASEQALEALTAYSRYARSEPALYCFSDVSGNAVVGADAPKTEENPATGGVAPFLAPAAVSLASLAVLLTVRKKSRRKN